MRTLGGLLATKGLSVYVSFAACWDINAHGFEYYRVPLRVSG